MNDTLILVISGVIAGSCPVLFAALGETLSEKAGVINLSLDGCILLSALSAFVATYHTSSLTAGFVAAILTGACVSLFLGYMAIYLQVSQVALGFVLSLFLRDLAYFFGNSYNRLQVLDIQPLFIPYLSHIPVLGPSLFSHNLVVYTSIFLPFLLWIYADKTKSGLAMKAVGENPYAAFARGYDPRWIRLCHVVAGGALTGASGAAFSLFLKTGWGRPQGCEGAGWIALALVIFGSWNIFRVAVGCYIFSFLQIMGLLFQQWFSDFPAQVFQVAPFPLMIFSLVLVHVTNRVSDSFIDQEKHRFRLLISLVRFLSRPAPAHLGKTFEP